MKKKILVSAEGFWPGFAVRDLTLRLPFLARKYELIEERHRPQFTFYSCFVADGKGRSRVEKDFAKIPRPRRGVGIFLTGENVVPDMDLCDYALSFSWAIDSPRHLRFPNWVSRLYASGHDPRDLLSANRRPAGERHRFCAFIYANSVPLRERFFTVLDRRRAVDAPGRSMNNRPPIGAAVADKLAYLEDYIFTIAFENEAAEGYTTEKIVEAFLAGTIPIYYGDPLVGRDFNEAAFLDLRRFADMEALADAVVALYGDAAALARLRSEPVYRGDTLPECAREERLLAFFETIFG